MNKQEIIICDDLTKELDRAIDRDMYDKLFLLADKHTLGYCLPALKSIDRWADVVVITIDSGEVNKNLDTLSYVWKELGERGATRHSLMINLGGGMVTDLGGFAASTFKRGIDYVNIPTTLLAMVDAAVGGKTGINFNGLKNEIGVFAPAVDVFIETEFLRTLSADDFLSGFAEMLKHGLINTTQHWAELLNFDLDDVDYAALKPLISKSVKIKKEIVEKDPFEQGIRKALNFGHTVGHAFESLALSEGKPVLHGYAIAWGMVCELYYSHLKVGFPKNKLRQTINFIKEHYGTFVFDCHQYENIYHLMMHDKKNVAGSVNFTLLEDIGKIKINQTARKEDIYDMLDFYRECMGV